MDVFAGLTAHASSLQLLEELPSPCYAINEVALEHNLQILQALSKATDVQILLALKGYAVWQTFPLIRRYLAGVTASSLNEALLGAEEFSTREHKKEIHVYAPAYHPRELPELLQLADHLTFNSLSSWKSFKEHPLANSLKQPAYALRLNAEHSEVSTPLYDPSAPYSRLGVTLKALQGADPQLLQGLSGLHIHNLCQAEAAAFQRTLTHVEKQFRPYFKQMKWLNFGGGQHITKEGFNVELLCSTLQAFKKQYDLPLYLEPGEAVAFNTGVLVSTVLDIVHNQMDIAILDTSASNHMPDVLEMPYRPEISGGEFPGVQPHTYRLAGNTCLAGDVIGDYSFAKRLEVGQKLIFGDMAHYSIVKNTLFNGVALPSIAIVNSETLESKVVEEFAYPAYKSRL